MFEELKAFLLATATPEYTDTAMATCELLTRAGLFSHEEGLLRLIAVSEDIDHSQMIMNIDYTLRDYLDEVLAMFSVAMAEETPLPYLNGAVEALLALPNYGDPQSVLSLLQTDQSEEEILCALLGLASDYHADDYLLYVQQHSPSLLTQIEGVANSLLIETTVEVDQQPTRQRLKRFVALHPGTMVDQAIRDGKALGSDFAELIEDYRDELDGLSRKPDALAMELVGFMLATSLPDAELREALTDELEDVVESINVITKVSQFINRYLAEVLIHEQA